MLGARGIAVSDELRERVLGCKDLTLLERWIVRATSAVSAADIIDELG